ncbi:uncharacterized protein DEA37_0008809 [Paragonimus westermani]|uniref:Uncharacterized protein n=1 Tax=Paragonimus westermani TaxID=34504 RepID=A0A5J4P3F7_9TREM|nr:uncharacterized protein DEA37_0008809 [Paragonimus westermani]
MPRDNESEFNSESSPSKKIVNRQQQEHVTAQSNDITSHGLKVKTQKSMKAEQNLAQQKIGRVSNILVEVKGSKKRSGCSSTTVNFVLHGQRSNQCNKWARTSESVNRLNERKYTSESSPKQKLDNRDTSWGQLGESNALEYEKHSDEKVIEDFGDMKEGTKRKRNNKEWVCKCTSMSSCNKRARPLSLSPERMHINDPGSTFCCPCKRNRSSSVSWYEPLICPCDYEKEARNYTDPQGTQHRAMTDENFMDNLYNIFNDVDNDITPAGVKNSPPTKLRKSISPETLNLLKSVEKPEVLDSISRRGLNREFEHGPTVPSALLSKSHRTDDKRSFESAPVSFRKEDSKIQRQVTPPVGQPSSRNIEQLSNTTCPTVTYYPVAQLPYFSTQTLPALTQAIPQNWLPPSLFIVPSHNTFTQVCTPSLLTQQFLPSTQMFGSYITPTVSPNILQPTLNIPKGFHSIGFC